MQIHNYICSLLVEEKVWYFLSGWCNTWRKELQFYLSLRFWMHSAFTSLERWSLAQSCLLVWTVKSKSVPFRTVLGRKELKMSVKKHNKRSALMNLTSSVHNQKHLRKYRFETSLQWEKKLRSLFYMHVQNLLIKLYFSAHVRFKRLYWTKTLWNRLKPIEFLHQSFV